MTCDRCGKPTRQWKMSLFNTDKLCPDCLAAEQAHPDYQKARDAEHAALLAGDYNFPGIGKPADL